MRFSKVFNISLHRNGTQSVHELLLRSGVSSIHWAVEVEGIDYEKQLAGHEEDAQYMVDVLAPVIDSVTSLSDAPFPVLYETLERRHPHSGFILAKRPTQDWIRSVRRQHAGNVTLNSFTRAQYWRYLPRRPKTLDQVSDAELQAMYLAHTQAVSQYFAGRKNLLALDLYDLTAGESICHFLGIRPLALKHIDYAPVAAQHRDVPAV